MAKGLEWDAKQLAVAKDRVSAFHDRMKTLEYPYHLPIGRGWKLVIEKEPELLRDKTGELTSIDAWVRAYRNDGREFKVDPHRVMSNPPVGDKDPAEFFWKNVADSVLQSPNPRGWNTKGTVTQFFISSFTTTYITSTNGTYATARTGGTLAAPSPVTSIQVGQNTGFVCMEGFLQFVTGPTIPDTDIVSVVTLDLPIRSDSTTTDFTCNVREKSWSSGGLTTADWVSGASLAGQTLVASRSTSGLVVGSLNTWTSQAAFLTTANLKTGNVELMLCSSRHEAGTSPTTNESFFVENDTDSSRLTVTYNSAGSFPPLLVPRPAQIWRTFS